MKLRWMIRSLLIVATGTGLVLLIHFLLYTHTGIRLTHTNVKQLSDFLQSLGTWSYVIGMAAVLIQTFFPILPFVVVAGANVLAFGLVEGFLINYITAAIGAVLTFFFARYAGHRWVERKLSRFPMLQQFNHKMESHGFLYVMLGRLIPIIPSSAINLGAGVTKTRFNHFLLGTLIGSLPMVLMESFIGFDLQHIRRNRGRLVVLLLIFVLLMVIGWILKRKWSNKKSNEEED